MSQIKTGTLSDKFLAETEQGINAALANGVDPEQEYLATLAQLAQPDDLPMPGINVVPQYASQTVAEYHGAA